MLLLQEMVACGEAALAADYRQQLGLPETALKIDPEELAAAEAGRKETYLQLQLPPGAVAVVDDARQLVEAGRALAAAGAVGIDVEWQPGGRQAPAALLQVRREGSNR
jgi:hypothetical protein